jgi:hypothetical protein
MVTSLSWRSAETTLRLQNNSIGLRKYKPRTGDYHLQLNFPELQLLEFERLVGWMLAWRLPVKLLAMQRQRGRRR